MLAVKRQLKHFYEKTKREEHNTCPNGQVLCSKETGDRNSLPV